MKALGESWKFSRSQESAPGRRRVVSQTVAQRLSEPGTFISIPRGEVLTWSGASLRDWRRVHVRYRNETWIISTAAWESAISDERY